MVASDDLFDLNRFVTAQAPVYERVLLEIKSGHKRTHWMWYIFPQLAGLGYSATAQHYGIKSKAEAEAYLHHPILGPRLVECCEAAVKVANRSATQIFGTPDDLKLHSCATLFSFVAPSPSVFDRLLTKYFDGKPDAQTLRILGNRDVNKTHD